MVYSLNFISMKIGELAARTGVSVSAIRFYEREGLLRQPERRESGYREYDDRDVQRVRLIATAKKQRFPLKVIRLCLNALDGADEPCGRIAAIVRTRLEQIDREIAELRELRTELGARLAGWQSGQLSVDDCLCAILESKTPILIKEKIMNKSTIEIYTAGCANCDEAVRIVKEAVKTCGCEVKVLPADSREAKSRGVNLAPCIWKDGERVFCGVPTQEEAVAKLRIAG